MSSLSATAPTLLEVVLQDQRVDRIAELAESLRVLGPPYRFQGDVWKCVEGGQPRVSEPEWFLMKYERQR